MCVYVLLEHKIQMKNYVFMCIWEIALVNLKFNILK